MTGGILAGMNNYCSVPCLMKGEDLPEPTALPKIGDRLLKGEADDVGYASASDPTPYPRPNKCAHCGLPYLSGSYGHTICKPCEDVGDAENALRQAKFKAKP